MENTNGFAFGFLAPLVIAGRRRHIGMTRQMLNGGDVYAAFKEVAYESAPQVVRREWLHSGLMSTLLQDVVNRLI